jgi:AcrR family transcriptional regulator
VQSPDPTPTTRGHKKKERTRRLLLDTALEVIAEQGEACAISDIAQRAGVSHGTFYNYFPDRDALFASLVPDVVAAFGAAEADATGETDPARRFAIISARALAHAAAAPHMVHVALRVDAVQEALLSGGAFADLRRDLVAGARQERFALATERAAQDVIVGALLVAARRVVAGHDSPAYRRQVLRHLLQSLGIDPAEATAIARDAVRAAG